MEYTVSLQTIGWINSLNAGESLQISPDFQRRAVWLEEERAKLIGTILEELPFPEVYFEIQTDPKNGSQRYIVVDWQQRITSILMFVNNEFPLNGTDTYFRDLADDIKKRFWNYNVVVRFLSMTDDKEIRDLFQRLNTNNIVLNEQELRNARYTWKYKTLCEKLSESPFFSNIWFFTPREIRRMLDIEYVSELVLQQIYSITNKKDMLETAYLKYEEDFPEESIVEEEFNIVIGLIRTFLTEENKTHFKSKTNFYSIFGTVLQFCRQNEGQNIVILETYRNNLTSFLTQVRDFGEQSKNTYVRDYSEAFTRAASDKQRRWARQEILFWVTFLDYMQQEGKTD